MQVSRLIHRRISLEFASYSPISTLSLHTGFFLQSQTPTTRSFCIGTPGRQAKFSVHEELKLALEVQAATSTRPGSMGVIHHTAIVHPGATIGEGVSIGPFCTVSSGANIGDGCKLHPSSHVFGNTRLGESCTLFTGAVVGDDLPGETIIGKNTSIGHHAVVGIKCQDLKYKDGEACYLKIGDNNEIREHVSIHRSSMRDDCTVIGNGNLIMGSCHIAHDVKLGNKNILANATLLGGHVVVENFIHTGGAAAVHQFCHVGSYSFVAGGSMVAGDVPMYTMVAGDRAELRGLNLEGLRRHGFSDVELRSLRRAYQRLFMNTDAAAGGLEDRLAELESDAELHNVQAVAQMVKSVRECYGEKRRGICKFRQWNVADIQSNSIPNLS